MSVYDNIFTQLIPTVNFDKITLSSGRGASPLNVKINFVLRDIVEEDMISSWFASGFEEDQDSSPFERYLKVKIIQCTDSDLCEILSGRSNESLLAEKGESIKDALKTIVKRDINLKDRIPMDRSTTTRAKGIQEYRVVQPDGTEMIEIPIEETFTVQPTDLLGIEHLSYFVWVTLDMAQLANDFGISEKFFKKSTPPSTVASEYVINDHSVITSTNVHLLPSGDPWRGPIHYHDPSINPATNDPTFKGYMTGKTHTKDSKKLSTVKIANSKIKDFRFVDRVDERYRSVRQARIGAGLVGGEAKVGEAIEEDVIAQSVTNYTKLLGKEVKPPKKSSVYTDMVLTSDEAHNGNGMFAIDFVSYLKNNSAYPYLWDISKETTLKLLSMSHIRELSIFRRQVDPKSRSNNRLGTPHLPIKKGDDFKERHLGTTSQPHGKKICKIINSSKIYLSETKVDLYGMRTEDSDGIRWFSFTDHSLINERNGTFQYSIELTALDPTIILLNRNIERLRKANRSLQKYLNAALGYTNTKVNFDIYLDKFIPDFIQKFYETKNVDMWRGSINLYLNTLKEVSSVLDAPAYPGSSYTLETVLPSVLSSYVDPVKGSPEGIQRTIDMINQLLKELENKASILSIGSTNPPVKHFSLGINDATAALASGNSGISIAGGKSASKLLKERYTFNQEIVLDGNRGKGYDYLTNQTLDFASDNVKGRGLRVVSSRYFKKRCEIETRRFFSVAESDINYETVLKKAVPDLSLSSTPTRDSLTNSKFSYLTPSFVFRSPGSSTGFMGQAGEAYAAQQAKEQQGSSQAEQADDKLGNQPAFAILGMSYNEPIKGTNQHWGGDISAPKNITSPTDDVTLQVQHISDPSSPVPSNVTNTNTTNTTITNVTNITNVQQEPNSVDDVHADIIAAQQNPDFSLFPISVKGYEGEHRGTKQSAAQQNSKKKYMDILAAQGTTVVRAKTEFFGNAHSMGNPASPWTFYEDDSVPSDEKLNTPTGPDYEVIDFAEDVGTKEKFYSFHLIQPPIPYHVLNINPTPVLSTLASSHVGLKMGYPKGPLMYQSMHMSNFQLLNFEDTTTPNILDGVNTSNKAATLAGLPNQLKSLVLASQNLTITNPFESPGPDQKPWMFDPKNMPKIWQLFGNITRIEYMTSFEKPIVQVQTQDGLKKKTGARPLMKSPQWEVLTKPVVDRLEAGNKKMALLCRVTRYTNKALGIGYSSDLDLPIIDKYFLLVIDPFLNPDLGRLDAVDSDGNLPDEKPISIEVSPYQQPEGQSNDSSNTDSDTVEAILKDFGLKTFTILDPEDPTQEQTITVKKFEGELLLCKNTGGDS